MAIESFATVIPVGNLSEAVCFWRDFLGIDPAFVDGGRWAQFDAGGRRIALAGSDRFADVPSLMLKADNLESVLGQLTERGAEVGDIERGAHEWRFTATVPGGWTVMIYAPTSRA